VRDLTTRVAVARGNAGPDAPELLREQRAELQAELGLLRARAALTGSLEERLEAAEGDRERLADAIAEVELESGTLDGTVRAKTADLVAARAELDALLAGTGASCLAELLQARVARVEVGRRACQALDDLAAATTALDGATGALELATAEAGFDTADEAVSALLSSAQLGSLETAVTTHDRRLAAVGAVLEEPGAAELAALSPPDVPGLEAGHAEALAALGDARSRASLWESRAGRLTRLAADLATALTAWAPLRDELTLTTQLASFVDGKSADNRLQMRLSAYVLSYRLSQVVAAANERLAGMSDQRYSLEHTGRRGAGETRGGLSLLIRDDWSGESRDPATLSGGETFVVSLALALGLADVITQEAGGADLDTLFVDEGFGSLDADTLDDVMDTLDSLRDGGRVVGVVSHVAEMRDRIPTQLRVTKSRHGSTIALTC
jgi:exonuclease SbcC